MFWAFKLSFVVDILNARRLFGLLFEKLGEFFSNILVTLVPDCCEWLEKEETEKKSKMIKT